MEGGGYSCQAAKTLTTKTRIDAETETLIAMHGGYFDTTYALAGNTVGRQPLNGGNGNGYDDGGASYTLTKTDVHAVAFQSQASSTQSMNPSEVCATLDKSKTPSVAFYENHPADSRVTEMGEVCTTVTSRWGTGGGNVPYAQMQMQVRRLTPTECARLQGFPDSYLSQVLGASDSAMYKALGNSMAVNVMQLIGQRIAMVDAIADIKAVA